MERAVITALDGKLNLDRALPEVPPSEAPPASSGRQEPSGILTAEEFESLERTNILRALEETGWIVAGEKGAAKRLGLNPSTLASRMKILGIRKPR